MFSLIRGVNDFPTSCDRTYLLLVFARIYSYLPELLNIYLAFTRKLWVLLLCLLNFFPYLLAIYPYLFGIYWYLLCISWLCDSIFPGRLPDIFPGRPYSGRYVKVKTEYQLVTTECIYFAKYTLRTHKYTQNIFYQTFLNFRRFFCHSSVLFFFFVWKLIFLW